jgi:3-methyl-2-oxobutanoate hydroxymethyltransferase
VPRDLGAEVTAALRIPTIGIGAGPDCDAQVLVFHDVLGLTQDATPKFVRAYASLGDRAKEALTAFAADVAAGTFPDDAHSYH